MGRHHAQSNSYKNSEDQSIISMMGYGSMQADMVLETGLRILHLDMQATISDLKQWAWLEHTCDFEACLPSDTHSPTRPHLLKVPLPLKVHFLLSYLTLSSLVSKCFSHIIMQSYTQYSLKSLHSLQQYQCYLKI